MWRKSILAVLLAVGLIPRATAQPVPPNLYQHLTWRMIGPYRAGRTVGATGVPGRPGVFYVGVNNGGVWKTTDYGRTWHPIFDDQPTSSIGDLAVAPSNPDVLYVGTGEGLHRPDLAVGDGMFKSTDGGQTWRHIGLSDAQQIAGIIVHPRNPDVVFVAALGHPYGPNEERGVYRTTDGGATWQKVLYFDEDTGAMQVAFDPAEPDVVYADLWAAREGPWENAAWQGATSGLYKSTDGGTTWRALRQGLPTAAQGLGRIGFDIAPSAPNRLYATVNAAEGGGIYRSDDAGESWALVNTDRRLWGRGNDFGEIRVHPRNPDVVYVGNVAAYRSTDGGRTFSAFKGAPGGDDYHRIWINPENPDVILLAADQGAVISVNGGETWSSWYNQPTAQLYHVTTDNRYPYRVYGGQQESGAVAVASRSDYGQITQRDWHPVRADEYAYVAPDPLNPDLVYGGRVVRFDRRTGQVQNVAPEALRSGRYRILRTMPLMFSPVDPHTLFFATNVLFKTTNGGHSWDIISPDLSREQPEVPESIGTFRTPELATMPRRGVIYALAPSPLDGDLIWAGTDDGLVHVTRDGGASWHDVTPPGLTAWSKISQLDAGHFDAGTAYAAVNRIRLDDMRPHIYRTHDGGRTWTAVTNGLPDNGPVNVVREDPERPGLLFAGTERAVYVSFNDGDDWQPLRLNMPAVSIRDLVVHGDDVVAATHGRGFWILDDITPLRQVEAAMAAAKAFLFAPQEATRVRWNMYSDTPPPPEEVAGKNPPDGAVIDYYLKAPASEVVLEILDAANRRVRRFANTDLPEAVDLDALPYAPYWIRPSQVPGIGEGMHRFVWDLHYPPPEGARRSHPITAVPGDTPSGPEGPWVQPGTYTLRLTVDGVTMTQPLTVRLDPRVVVTPEALQVQFDASMACYEGYGQAQTARATVQAIRAQARVLRENDDLDTSLRMALTRLDEALALLEGPAPGNPDTVYGSATAAPPGAETLGGVQQKLLFVMAVLQGADAPPTTQALAAVGTLQETLREVLGRWEALREADLRAVNERLMQGGLAPLEGR